MSWSRCVATLLLGAALCTAAEVKLTYLAQNISITDYWITCGYYGLEYSTACNDTVAGYVTLAEACAPGAGPEPSFVPVSNSSTCGPLAGQEALSCAPSVWCDRVSLHPNNETLCLVLSRVGSSSNSSEGNVTSTTTGARCDVTIWGRAIPITAASKGLAWPVWKIVAVSVGGGVGVLITAMLCGLACYVRRMDQVGVTAGETDDPEPGDGHTHAKVAKWDVATSPAPGAWARSSKAATPQLARSSRPYGHPHHPFDMNAQGQQIGPLALPLAPLQDYSTLPAPWPALGSMARPSPLITPGNTVAPFSGSIEFPPAFLAPQQPRPYIP